MDPSWVTVQNDRFETNRRGEYAVAKVLLRAIDKGVSISRPVIECRYDLVLDDGIKLYRTQVKYANGSIRQAKGVVPVRLSKWRNDGRATIPYYTASEIDLLLVYLPVIDRILWFGPEIFDGRAVIHVRHQPSLNNQMKGCILASDYVW